MADTESWKQKAAKALEEMDEIHCYVKNSLLNFHIPYVMEGIYKKYVPDFILRVKTPSGKTINLILEISGFSQDKDYKTNFVYNRWLPAVNNIREKCEMDEWHFLEVSAEIRDIKKEIRVALVKADMHISKNVPV